MKRDLKFAKKIEWEEKDTFCIGFDEMGPDWRDMIYEDRSKNNVVEWVYTSNMDMDMERQNAIKVEEGSIYVNLIGYGEPAGKRKKVKKDLKSEVYPGLRG